MFEVNYTIIISQNLLNTDFTPAFGASASVNIVNLVSTVADHSKHGKPPWHIEYESIIDYYFDIELKSVKWFIQSSELNQIHICSAQLNVLELYDYIKVLKWLIVRF